MLGARDILVIPAAQPHAIEWKRTAAVISLQLSQDFVAEALEQPTFRLRDDVVLRDPFVSAAAAQIRANLSHEPRFSSVFAEALVTAIAYRIGMGASSADRPHARRPAPPLSAPQLARIHRLIAERLDHPITLTELAAVAGVGIWQFMRRFYASYGTSPHEFITQRRLERAKILLSTSDLTITGIALEVGMSHSHFSRTFLSRTGVTPREYRQRRSS